MRGRLALILAAAALTGCGGGDETGAEEAPPSGDAGEVVEVRLTEYSLDPATVTLDRDGTYTFRALNEGGVVHALEIEGDGIESETSELQPGDSGEIRVEVKAGEYELYCPVADHKDRGMVGRVVVGAAPGATTGDEAEDEGVGYGY